MSRRYRYWSDEILWEVYCWSCAKRRLGNLNTKAIDYATTTTGISMLIRKARKNLPAIEQRLGKTREDRETKIRGMLQ